MDQSNDEQYAKMLNMPMPKLITSLAVPTTVSQLITTVYNITDTYFVSHIGTSATAAVGIVFALMSIIQAVGFGIGMGANSIISRCLGEKDEERASRCANSALLAAFVFGLLLMAAGLPTLRRLMLLLGSTKTILPYSCGYGKYILIGAPVMCTEFVLNNILRSEGQAMLAMWGLVTGSILNIFLEPVFIFVLHLGIAGAAVATIISQFVSFVVLVVFFLRGKSIIKLNVKFISKEKADYILILRTGFPTICRQMLGSLSAALMNIQSAAYGDSAVAAVTIANKVYMFIRNIVIGIGQGFQPVAGYNYGAKNNRRVKEAFIFACKAGTAVCAVAAVAVAFKAPYVISWFRKDDAEVIRVGTAALYISCCVVPFMAYSTYVNQLYQSLGFSMQATWLASCRQGIFFVPMIFILPAMFGLTGVIASQPVSDFLTFIISVPCQIHFFRKYLKTCNECDGKNIQRLKKQ